MADGVFVGLAFLVALASPLVLWALTQSETDDVPVMDRTAAERTARRDTHDGRDADARRNDRNR